MQRQPDIHPAADGVPLAHERPQRPGQIIGNRHNALFASFAAQEHLGSCTIEIKVADIDAECFGNTRAGATEEKQQRPIATTARGSLI